MDNNTRIIDLTVGELMEVIARQLDVKAQDIFLRIESHLNKEVKATEGPLYGLDGMCEALHCSKSKVVKLKKDGVLDGAYQQIGGTIIVNDPQALRDVAEFHLNKTKQKVRTKKSLFA